MSTIQVPKVPDLVYISFMSEVTPSSAEGLLEACSNLSNQGAKTIYLLLGTPGGSVTHGIHVYSILRALPCKVVTHNVGAVDSIGNVIFLAGEERYANPGSTFMFHGVARTVRDQGLNEKQLTEGLESVRSDQRKIAHIVASRTKFPDPAEIEQLFFQAAFKEAEFAKDRGIIHEIREAKIAAGAPIFQLVFKR